mgnify:CR=1 FL=1
MTTKFVTTWLHLQYLYIIISTLKGLKSQFHYIKLTEVISFFAHRSYLIVRHTVHVPLLVTLYLLKVFSHTISILGSEPILLSLFPAQFSQTTSSLWNNSNTRFFAKLGIEELLQNTSSNNVCGYPFGGCRTELGIDEVELGVVVVGIVVEILDVVGNTSKEFGVVKHLGVVCWFFKIASSKPLTLA